MIYLLIVYNYQMFPATNKEQRQMLLQPSPKYSRDAHKSTYLPYFKRFPNQKFHSQERKRTEETVIAPRRFFTEEKQQTQPDHTIAPQLSSYSIKQRSPNKLRPRLFRQLYERESNKNKRSSEHSVAQKNNRIVVNSSFNVHTSASYFTPAQLIKTNHNLSDYQLAELEENYSQIYYWGQNCPKKIFSQRKQREGQQGYPWAKGDHVAYRYQFIEVLGQGSFGQVFKCLDHKNNRAPVALKMVKNNEKYLNQAKIQIKILNLIKSKDPLSSKNCVELREYFPFRNRICMIFSLMAINLYELIKSNGYYGLPLDLIRRFVLQILNGIHFLHKNRIIHADLKPENILLKETNKSGIKIIDFGSSCLQHETIYTYIQSRYYRAPQVILGLPYDRKIDIWSFGCIIAELHLGFPLFGGEDEHQQMCLIIQVLGMPPKDMFPNSKRWHVFFDNNNTLKPHEKRMPPGSKTLASALESAEEDFIQFIRLCLQWNPQRRIQALQLMKNPWVLRDLPADFRQQHLKFISQQQTQLMQEDNSVMRKTKKHTFTIRDRHRLIK